MRSARLVVLMVLAAPAAAQGWRADLDVGLRSVAFRGVQLDTILRADLAPDSSFLTPDGYAASCVPGALTCTYYRAGDRIRAVPMTARATADLWGWGVRGLRFHVDARILNDLGSAGAWPLTSPPLQLLEGYAELARPAYTVQVGRVAMTSRLGWQGLDGAHGTLRLAEGRLNLGAWGGWGLAEGVALPLSSSVLNPLDEYQPRNRQVVAGADVSWHLPSVRGRVIYQREVDPAVDYFLSERAAGDAQLRITPWLTAQGGAEYDLAFGEWGSADGALTVVAPYGVRVSLGGRRYRPYFPLWTVWGAFSPSPYHAWTASVDVPVTHGVSAWVRGERYRYAASNATTGLVRAEDHGWRWSWGGQWVPNEIVRLAVGADGAFGPGASALGMDATATVRPRRDLAVSVRAGRVLRPLELRFDEATAWQLGGDVQWSLDDRLRVSGGLVWVDEQRDRPDAAALTWNQVRLSLGLHVGFGRGADRPGLPPAVLAMPEGR